MEVIILKLYNPDHLSQDKCSVYNLPITVQESLVYNSRLQRKVAQHILAEPLPPTKARATQPVNQKHLAKNNINYKVCQMARELCKPNILEDNLPVLLNRPSNSLKKNPTPPLLDICEISAAAFHLNLCS
jgi:hypothetical protein